MRLENSIGDRRPPRASRAVSRTKAGVDWANFGTRLASKGLSATRARWAAVVIGVVLGVGGATWMAADVAGRQAIADLEAQAQTTASLQSAVLRTKLERYRSLAYVLGHDAEVLATLRSGEPATTAALDRKLEVVSRETNVDVIYLLNTSAYGVAMSNWRESFKFCRAAPGLAGRGCRDRYYFTQAMRGGTAEFFALGRANKRPGMYFSHAVDDGAERLGVVVAKVEFGRLEREWAKSGIATFVTDRNGVVLISSRPDWRFRTLGRLEGATKTTLIRSGQFGASSLEPLPIVPRAAARGDGLVTASIRPGEAQAHMLASAPMSTPGWTLHVLKPASQQVEGARLTAAAITFLAALLVLTIVGIVFRARARGAREPERQVAAKAELEARVVSRTAELSAANQRLLAEMAERRRMERNLHELQDELVQANKLATLGQIAAGVAHEINQPVAAIRTYAENAVTLIERAQSAEASRNLALIGDLTGRISLITDALRAFARRATRETVAVDVSAAIDGALLLLSHRISVESVKLLREGERAGLTVRAERVRLEQVLVNLLQNALDALRPEPDRRITISVRERSNGVNIAIGDNGTGMSAETMASLFMPFVTTKSRGLGLGLVISRDIVTEFGGDLTASASEKGAWFTISLKKAA